MTTTASLLVVVVMSLQARGFSGFLDEPIPFRRAEIWNGQTNQKAVADG